MSPGGNQHGPLGNPHRPDLEVECGFGVESNCVVYHGSYSGCNGRIAEKSAIEYIRVK